MSEILTTEEFRAHTAGNCGCCQGNAECADVPGSDGCCHDADDRRHGRMTLSEWESGCDCHTMMRHDAALRAEVERLRKALGYITDISEANADRAIVEMKRIAHEALDSAPAEEGK